MSRYAQRVPLDFDAPIGVPWHGYVMPTGFRETPCGRCDQSGYSDHARRLYAQWYGNVAFRPTDTGSTPLTPDTPAVRARAERNVAASPAFYGTGEAVIRREAERLCEHWNGSWSHHLDQDDVDALLAKDRLWDLTRRWVPSNGWVTLDPPPTVTAADVNLWSLTGFGHDSINAGICVTAKAIRGGDPHKGICPDCEGHGSTEAYPGQRADAEAWEPTEPPTGDGWQMWSDTGYPEPRTPVFATAEALAEHCATERLLWFGSETATAEKWLGLFTGTEMPGVAVGDNAWIM